MKQNTNKTNNESKLHYGFWQMFATIVGIVVGIGIFFKNGTVIGLAEGNEIIGIVSWVIGSVVIISLAYLYIEIYSAKKSDGTSGSITDWSKNFLGKKGGVAATSFWQYIYLPLTIFILAIFSTDMIVSLIDTTKISDMGTFFIYFSISIFLVALIPLLNSTFSKPSKIIQTFGTVIKFIPIVVVIIGSIVLMITTPDAHSSITTGTSDKNPFLLLLAVLPAVFFAFDGFLAASQLQNQAKDNNTYKKALLFGLSFIAITYTIIALLTFFVSDDSMGYAISDILWAISGGIDGIQITLLIIIFISGVTSLSGFASSGNWNKYNIVENGLISDKDGNYLEKNKEGLPQKSGRSLWKTSLAWTISVFLIGFIVIVSSSFSTSDFMGAVDSLSNTYIIIAFMIYGSILIGGMVNRKTNKVEVKKVKMFIPISLIVTTFIYVISLYSFVTTIQASVIDPSNLGGWFLFMVIAIWLVSSITNYYSVKWEKYPKEVLLLFFTDYRYFASIPSTIYNYFNETYKKVFKKENK
ncbi:MAG: APC family permease [Mycoplasmataceae bacterium]|nr:APC family permease [Mycoplasmataceae bacterium]